MAAGKIRIETEINTKKFDKQVDYLDNQVSSLQDRIKQKKMEVNLELGNFDKEIEKAKKRLAELEKMEGSQEINEEYANLELELKKLIRDKEKASEIHVVDVSKEEAEIEKLQNKIEELYRKAAAEKQRLLSGINVTNTNVPAISNAQGFSISKASSIGGSASFSNVADDEKDLTILERIKAKISEIVAKRKESVKASKETATEDSKSSNSMDALVGKMGGLVKGAKKWAFAIIGVRTAFGALQSAMSIVGQYNTELAQKLENIKYTLAFALEPVLVTIVNWIQLALQYVQYLIKALTGYDIFASAAKNSKKMEKNTKATATAMKQLQTTGFDEVNKISDSGSAGAGGTNTGNPSAITALPEGEVPEWLKWIVDNKDLVIAALSGIAAAIVLIKLGVDGIIALGIGLVIAGLVIAIQGLIEFLKNPTWKNFAKILEGIALILAGLAVIFMSWPLAVAAVVAAIVALIISNWEVIKDFFAGIGKWLWDNVCLPIWELIKAILDTILATIQNTFISPLSAIITALVGILKAPFVTWWETAKKVIDNIKSAFSNLVDGIKKLFSGDLKGALESFKKMFGNVFDGLGAVAKAPLNLAIEAINSLIKGVNKVKIAVPKWVPEIGGKEWGFNIPKIPKLAVGGIINMPGRGTYYGGATIAEKGPEAVIPLTNEEMMQQLGESIGRYITINANITNSMNGRVISRELQKIQNKEDFAYNG